MHKVIEEISESNSWRDREFASFKMNSHNVNETLWCRMCLPMIYAHWEGFVVNALKTLITHLNTLSLKPTEVTTKLIVISLDNSYQSLSGKQSFEQRVEFTHKFKNLFEDVMKFKKKINTKSNLNADVLKELCFMFDFNFDKFRECISDINRLVQIRNSIAHGENSFVLDQQNIRTYITSVNMAMDIFLNEIDEFLTQEKYLLNIAQT